MNFKKVTSFLLIFMFIFHFALSGVGAKSNGHWAAEYIDYLMQQPGFETFLNDSGIVNNPDKPIYGEEFSKMLHLWPGVDDKEDTNTQKYIDRETAISDIGMLLRLKSYDNISFIDENSIPTGSRLYVSAFEQQGIIVGYSDKAFHPKDYLTGAQAIVIISKLIKQGYKYNNKVTDFAGKNVGYKDGGSLNSDFFRPVGLCSDGNGGILVADSYNGVIRRVYNQNVETVAGKKQTQIDEYGIPIGGYLNARSKEALFNKPEFIAVNTTNGDIIVSDTENNSIRLIKNSQVSSLDSSTAAGYRDGALSQALFNKPSDVAFDKSGNIYIADTLNNCIRYIDLSSLEVSTIAGNPDKPGFADGPAGDALFNQPIGLAIDKQGVLYVSDSGNQRIRKIENGVASTVAGSGYTLLEGTSCIEGGYADGQKDKAKFDFPGGIDVDNSGNIIVADTGNHRIREITATKVMTIAGNGEAGYMSGIARASSFNEPSDVLILDGKIYISDSFNCKIRVMDMP